MSDIIIHMDQECIKLLLNFPYEGLYNILVLSERCSNLSVRTIIRT